MSVYHEVLNTLRDRKLAYVDRLVPAHVCSLGAHVVNLQNKTRKFYLIFGRVADLRVHIFFIAPSGYFKSEVLYQLLDEETGVVSGTRIGTAFEGGMTAAAFVGTVKINKDGEAEIESGAAKYHEKSIVGIEEFAEITNMMKQTYNVQMADALLTALDKGWVRKRLARSGEKGIHYPTNLTLWTGSQPTRLDLASGLGRRFHMQEFIPTREQRDRIREARRAGRNALTSTRRVMKVKNMLEELYDRSYHIEKIKFTRNFDQFLHGFQLIHYEEELMERLSIGYNFMKGTFDSVLKVEIDQDLKDLIERCIIERRSVKMDSEINQVIYILRDYEGEMTISEMVFELANFGIDGRAAYKLIMSARDTGRVSIQGDLISSRWARKKKK